MAQVEDEQNARAIADMTAEVTGGEAGEDPPPPRTSHLDGVVVPPQWQARVNVLSDTAASHDLAFHTAGRVAAETGKRIRRSARYLGECECCLSVAVAGLARAAEVRTALDDRNKRASILQCITAMHARLWSTVSFRTTTNKCVLNGCCPAAGAGIVVGGLLPCSRGRQHKSSISQPTFLHSIEHQTRIRKYRPRGVHPTTGLFWAPNAVRLFKDVN